MGKWKYRKQEPSDVRGLCVICDKNLQKPKRNGRFYSICRQCDKRMYSKQAEKRRKREKPQRTDPIYKQHKSDTCSNCGFVALHKCQLDVDHIDNNCKNNDPSNLRTLCSNCHRLKTYTNLLN